MLHIALDEAACSFATRLPHRCCPEGPSSAPRSTLAARQSAPYPARRLCHTAFPGGLLSRRTLHIAPAKPCIPCRRLSSSGALRQSKPASRQRPIRPHHRKSTAFSRRAALSRDIAPFQAAVALHGQTRRIKSALHGQAHPFRPYFYQNLERVSARFRLICQKFVTSNAPKARFPTYKPRATLAVSRISSVLPSAAASASSSAPLPHRSPRPSITPHCIRHPCSIKRISNALCSAAISLSASSRPAVY